MKSLRAGILFFLLTYLLSACGDPVVGWPTSDTVAPTISSTIPVNNATDVELNTAASVTFSEDMDSRTLSSTTFSVTTGNESVRGTITYLGVTATFIPLEDLIAGTTYEATITQAVTDLAGNPLAADYVWSFTTGAAIDTTAPEVSATTPSNNAIAVEVNTAISVTFSEPMLPTSLSASTLLVFNGTTPVSGDVTYFGVTATFTPTENLEAGITYMATVTTGARDLAGNSMAADYLWSFTTIDASDDNAPQVSFTTPANNAPNVAFNAAISATFSEPMNQMTISAATFTVLDGTTPVPGTVVYVGTTAIFTATMGTNPDTLYTATIASEVEDLAGNAMANPYTWTFTTGSVLDDLAPEVIFTTPATGAIDVPFNAAVSATFSEAMDPATISTTTFTVLDGTTPVAGNVVFAGVTAIFTATNGTVPNTLYTATIKTGVKDLAGNALAAPYIWTFTTNEDADTTPPGVIFTTPSTGAVNVPFNAAVSATFSEAIDPTTMSAATFTVLDGTTPVAGTVVLVGVTAIFTATNGTVPNTLYTATIKTGVKDLSANALAAPYVWTFTTNEVLDTTPPQVIFTTPSAGAINVPFNAAISATFSEAMDPMTISTTTFTVLDGTTPVPGTVVFVGVTAIFTATAGTEPNTLYTATITTGVKDLAGNAMVSPFVWSFTTGASIDNVSPTVISTNPLDGATNSSTNTTISAIFNETMNPLTLSPTTFTVLDGVTPVVGTLNYVGVIATFTPAGGLNANTQYTATITTGATDLVGNPLAADFTWTFTTGAMADTKRPIVTFTTPADDDTGVAVSANIAAVFSEIMAPTTITVVNFTVQQLDVYVLGVVTYTGVTATLKPTADLAPNTTYSATLTTAAKDLAGNSLTQNYVWNFKTGAATDATKPTVISTIPADLDIDVPLVTDLTVTFSEAMDAASVNTTTFLLMNGLVPVTGVITQTGLNGVFVPTSPLLASTLYTATITTGATDLAGNPLGADYVWTFTTGLALDLTNPIIILVNPLDGAIDVPINTTVSATFSEDMDPLSVTTATFGLTGPGGTEVTGTVIYDALTMIGTFEPSSDLMSATTYTATVTIDAKDLAGNPMLLDYVWSFNTGDILTGMLPVNLGSLSTFVAVAGSGLTNSNSGGTTTLNGDVGLTPTGTCLGDGSPCTITNPVINGTLYINDAGGVAAQAKIDLTAAYVDATSRPVGTTVNDLSGMTLAPGVYTSDSTMSVAVGGTVTLDGQGDANAVWIFQIGSSLTVNNDAKVVLVNGAKAKNVFWAVFASSTLGSNVSFAGSVLAGESNSVGTNSIVVGRLLCTVGQITLLSDTITLPTP